MSFVLDSFRLWFKHFALFAGITLAVWLPGNILLTTIMALMGDELTATMALRIPMFFQAFLGPLSAGAILFATDCLVRGEQIGIGQAMNHGFSNWGRLFGTRFVSNFMTGIGLLCFVIPGIVMLVRFAFIDQAVIVDELSSKEARQRSWDLAPKVLWRLILISTLFITALLAMSVVLWLPLELLLENGQIPMPLYYVGDVIASCCTDLMYVPLIIALYFLYKEASGDQVNPAPQMANEPLSSETMELPSDDGNPYNSPRT